MSSELVGAINPLAPEPKVADRGAVRQFVKDLGQAAEKIKDARADLKEAIESNDEIQNIDEQIKQLREERKALINNSTVIQSYVEIVNEAIDEKRQIISNAKDNGVPRGEIDLAIRALKKDLDMKVSTEVYTNIADLVE
jgi:predicted  nucleic acid-binding Zn-ribbon protein